MPRALAPRNRASELEADRDREWLEQFAETVRLIERGHKLTRAEAERHIVLLDPAPPVELTRDSSAAVPRQARKRRRPRLTITADHFDDDDFD